MSERSFPRWDSTAMGVNTRLPRRQRQHTSRMRCGVKEAGSKGGVCVILFTQSFNAATTNLSCSVSGRWLPLRGETGAASRGGFQSAVGPRSGRTPKSLRLSGAYSALQLRTHRTMGRGDIVAEGSVVSPSGTEGAEGSALPMASTARRPEQG